MSLEGFQKIDRRKSLSSRPCMVKSLWFVFALEGENKVLYSSDLLVANSLRLAFLDDLGSKRVCSKSAEDRNATTQKAEVSVELGRHLKSREIHKLRTHED